MTYQQFGKYVYDELLIFGLSQDKSNIIASFAASQAANESANFTSPSFLKTNNCIGYGFYEKSDYQNGKKLKVSDDVGYLGSYDSVQLCAKELAHYLNRGTRKADLLLVQTLNNYCFNLKTYGYFSETLSDYYSSCNYYYKKYGNLNGSTLLLVGNQPSKFEDLIATILSYFKFGLTAFLALLIFLIFIFPRILKFLKKK